MNQNQFMGDFNYVWMTKPTHLTDNVSDLIFKTGSFVEHMISVNEINTSFAAIWFHPVNAKSE